MWVRGNHTAQVYIAPPLTCHKKVLTRGDFTHNWPARRSERQQGGRKERQKGSPQRDVHMKQELDEEPQTGKESHGFSKINAVSRHTVAGRLHHKCLKEETPPVPRRTRTPTQIFQPHNSISYPSPFIVGAGPEVDNELPASQIDTSGRTRFGVGDVLQWNNPLSAPAPSLKEAPAFSKERTERAEDTRISPNTPFPSSSHLVGWFPSPPPRQHLPHPTPWTGRSTLRFASLAFPRGLLHAHNLSTVFSRAKAQEESLLCLFSTAQGSPQNYRRRPSSLPF